MSDTVKRVLTLVVFSLGFASGIWGCLGIPAFSFTIGANDSPQAVWACFLAFGTTLPASVLAFWQRRIAGLWFIAVGIFFMYGMLAQRAYMIDVVHSPQASIHETLTQWAPYTDWLLLLGLFALITDLLRWPKPLYVAHAPAVSTIRPPL